MARQRGTSADSAAGTPVDTRDLKLHRTITRISTVHGDRDISSQSQSLRTIVVTKNYCADANKETSLLKEYYSNVF